MSNDSFKPLYQFSSAGLDYLRVNIVESLDEHEILALKV
jgi:hypothetical protein